MGRALSVEEHQLKSSFLSIRESLLKDKRSEAFDRPLAHWAFADDANSPFALLGQTLRELLNTPFEELASTPGIGVKKIYALIAILQRVENELAEAKSKNVDRKEKAAEPKPVDPKPKAAFRPAQVSEAMWEKWRETVRRFGLEREMLGRLSPTLQNLPTGSWELPVSHYLNYSVKEIRTLKAHGVKRVRGVLEVFHSIHQVLSQGEAVGHLTVRLMPAFILPVERWLIQCIEAKEGPSADEVRASLAVPLVEQIEIDCGSHISRLVAGRWGLHGERSRPKSRPSGRK
jgi:hypothetical protein